MNKLKNLVALSFGILLSIILLEIGLRVYNPFPVRMKNGNLFLPANRTFTFHNKHIPGLDTLITVTNNSLGFRGQEPPKNFSSAKSIIAVGGSTTECRFISDNGDWVTLLGDKLNTNLDQPLWVNNAGLAGNSTFGHRILLNQHIAKIKPDYVVYLIGINEVLRSDDFNDDLAIQINKAFSFQDWVKKNSEIALIINNIRRSIKAYSIESGHGRTALELENRAHFDINQTEIKESIKEHSVYIKAYEQRLISLLNETMESGIKPIVLTQPLLYGQQIDELSGVDLATVSSRFEYGSRYWAILESYNEITRKNCKDLSIPLIDLAYLMPKSSRYFYDSMHFNKEGAKVVSEILHPEIFAIISEQYSYSPGN